MHEPLAVLVEDGEISKDMDAPHGIEDGVSAVFSDSMQIDPRIIPEGLEFRLGAISDIPKLVELSEKFFAESQYGSFGIKFSSQKYTHYLETTIDRISPHILAVIDDEVVGFVSWLWDETYSERPIATLSQIYVVPERRRSAIGRMLIDMATSIARDSGACAFMCGVNGGTHQTNSLGNLFARSKFRMSGFVMTKGLD